MVVTCHSCAAKFRVDDSKIGPRGVKVRCAKCQTMIIVRPQESTLSEQDAPTRSFERPVVPPPEPSIDMNPPMPSFDDEDEAPSFHFPPPRAAAPASPPQVATPPPLRAAALGPLVPAPSFSQEQAAISLTPATSLDEGDDLFSNPFAAQTPAAPAPLPQGFVDVGSEGPSLELDMPGVSPAAAPPSTSATFSLPPAQAADPFAELPRFEDEPPSFSGEMSDEGRVTRPISLEHMQAVQRQEGMGGFSIPSSSIQAAPEPEARERDSHQRTREADTSANIAARERERAKGKTSRMLAWLGRAAILLLCAAGLAGELIVFRAGGLRGLMGHAALGNAALLKRVTLYPVLALDGTTFVVLRGEVQGAAEGVDIAVEGKKLASVRLGASFDDTALFARSEIVAKAGQDPQSFRFAWKDTRPLETLKQAIQVDVR